MQCSFVQASSSCSVGMRLERDFFPRNLPERVVFFYTEAMGCHEVIAASYFLFLKILLSNNSFQ